MWCAEVSSGRFESVSGHLSELVNKDFIIDIQLERIPLVHRATTVFCDSRAANYAVLQSHPNSWSFTLFVVLSVTWTYCVLVPWRRHYVSDNQFPSNEMMTLVMCTNRSCVLTSRTVFHSLSLVFGLRRILRQNIRKILLVIVVAGCDCEKQLNTDYSNVGFGTILYNS